MVRSPGRAIATPDSGILPFPLKRKSGVAFECAISTEHRGNHAVLPSAFQRFTLNQLPPAPVCLPLANQQKFP